MAHLIPRRIPYICKACRSTQVSSQLVRTFTGSSSSRNASLRQQLHERSPEITSTKATSSRQKPVDVADGNYQRIRGGVRQTRQTDVVGDSVQTGIEVPTIANPQQVLRELQQETLSILESDVIPNEKKIHEILRRAQQLAIALVHVPVAQPAQQSEQLHAVTKSQTSSQEPSLLSDLNEPVAQPAQIKSQEPPTLSTTDRETYAARLAQTIYTLLEDPKVFISEPTLTTYTTTITTLSLPQYLPAIFHLYAHKPIPIPSSSNPIKYRNPFSRAPKYAIPPKVTDQAITSAIARRDLPLTISLIDLTVNTPQYFAAKFIRKAALPLLGASSVVPLSYSLSNSAAMYQLSWDPDTFFWMCIAGSTAYLGTMGTLLWITVTTWNDHHKRVRWVGGTPLGRRWFREEERMYFDRVAAAWGYQDVNRHGEETGEEWEALREVLGMRYMEVDRSSLLPGML